MNTIKIVPSKPGCFYVGDRVSTYLAKIKPGESIHIWGEARDGKRQLRKFDVFFKIGDVAFYAPGQKPSDRGEILKITRKTVTLRSSSAPYYLKTRRLDLYTFAYCNAFGDEIRRHPVWQLHH